MIRCTDLTCETAGKAILRGCTFTVPKGTHWLLTGPSGAGKTTLLRLIAGLAVPVRGRIEIGGRIVSEDGKSKVPPHLRGVGMVFQDLGLWPRLTVAEHLSCVLDRASTVGKERRIRVASMIAACRLTGLERRRPAEISAGEQQRLALARCLIPGPECVLLDEPFTGMDVLLKREVCALLRDLRREHGLTLITVTHAPSDVLGLEAEQVAVLEEGRIAETIDPRPGAVGECASRTGAEWRRLLVGSGE